MALDRITFDPQILGGKACIRGMRFPVSTIVKQVAAGMTSRQTLDECELLEEEDIAQALEYAARLTDDEVVVAGMPS